MTDILVSDPGPTPLCDACGHQGEPLASLAEMQAYVDTVCPKCGHAWITQADVDTMAEIYAEFDRLNAIAKALGADVDPDATHAIITTSSLDGGKIIAVEKVPKSSDRN